MCPEAWSSTMNFSTSYGVSTIARPLPVLSAADFRTQVGKNGGILEDFGSNTDWQNQITRSAITQNHNLSLGGGAKNLTYYASFGAQMQQGILKNNQLDRLSGRMNVTQKFWEDRLIIDANISFSNLVNLRPPIESLLGTAISNNPTLPVYEANGTTPAKFLNASNPLITLNLNKDINTANRFIANISPSVKLAKGLIYKLNYGYDNQTAVRDIQSLANLVPQQNGRLDTYNNSNQNSLVENYLTFNLEEGDHVFSALLGHSFQKIQYQGKKVFMFQLPHQVWCRINRIVLRKK